MSSPGVTFARTASASACNRALAILALAGIERDDRGVDELEQLSERRPACYIATRAAIRTHSPARSRLSAASPQTPDSSPETTLLRAPALSCDIAGPVFDSRRLHKT